MMFLVFKERMLQYVSFHYGSPGIAPGSGHHLLAEKQMELPQWNMIAWIFLPASSLAIKLHIHTYLLTVL